MKKKKKNNLTLDIEFDNFQNNHLNKISGEIIYILFTTVVNFMSVS